MKTLAVVAALFAIFLFCAGAELGTFFVKLVAPQSAMAAQHDQKHSAPTARSYEKYMDMANSSGTSR